MSGGRVVAVRLQSEMVVKEPASDRVAKESPLSLNEKGVTAEEKSPSLVAKGGTAEEARLRWNLLGPLIKYIFVRTSFSPLRFSSPP